MSALILNTALRADDEIIFDVGGAFYDGVITSVELPRYYLTDMYVIVHGESEHGEKITAQLPRDGSTYVYNDR